MFTPRPHRGTHLHTAARWAAARLGRLAAALAAITCAGLVSAASASAAPVMNPIPPGGPAVPAPAVRVVTVGGGMAGCGPQPRFIRLPGVWPGQPLSGRPQARRQPGPAAAGMGPGIAASDPLRATRRMRNPP
jgi:hypothetical protein